MGSFVFKSTRRWASTFGLKSTWERIVNSYLWSPERLEHLDKQGKRLFQIVGVPRSGTTLLASVLDGHRDVLCLSEPFRQWFLSGEVRMDELERYTGERAWSKHPAELIQVLLKQDELNHIGIKETFFEGPGHNELENSFFIRGLAEGKALDATVAIVRDPRDIWLSVAERQIASGRSPQEWARVTDRFVENWNRFVAWVLDQKIPFCKYEELVQHPAVTVRDISGHLGIPFHEGMLTLKPRQGEGDRKALAGGNITHGSAGRYRREAVRGNEEAVINASIIEAKCKAGMDAMAYLRHE